MSNKKIYTKLPAVHQTTAIKNFFESTVEQLFSKSEVDSLLGFIGSPSSADIGVIGSYISEPTVTKRFYGLTPTVNTISSETGESENFLFYDELIDTLATYGVDTRNHNKIFSENFGTFMPPIDPDKLINYAEYYWVPAGPDAIQIEGTLADAIDIDTDILGQAQYTPTDGKAFSNGMVVEFVGDYVIPQSRVGVEYIVYGVGESIQLLPKDRNLSNRYSGNNPQEAHDYVVQKRGATNQNAWSRINHWYHRDNFVDAGMDIPNREFRANRPIIEFDRELELYSHGTSVLTTVNAVSDELTLEEINGFDANSDITIDGVEAVGSTFIFPQADPEIAQYIYTASVDNNQIVVTRAPDPSNPTGAVDGDSNFVPLTAALGDIVQITDGVFNVGSEYVWRSSGWVRAQEKINVNQAPLFTLYDSDGVYLGDNGKYPDNNFTGNKLFGYATEAGEGTIAGTVADAELGFTLVFRQFKASSEIVFENYQNTVQYDGVTGYTYYKLLKETPEFHAYWKIVDEQNLQRIYTTYTINRLDVDQARKSFFVGGFPSAAENTPTGFDIRVRVNDVERSDYTYGTNLLAFIDFANPLEESDFVEIDIYAPRGLISTNSVSKYELPIGWSQNPDNADINFTSEPEYLTHFADYMKNQSGFTGDALSINNFADTEKAPRHALDIIQTNQDVILGAFLIDDQPHNLVDALRFNAQEYIKYKNRVKSEIEKFYSTSFVPGMTLETMLEQVLRNVIAYKVGREVFNRTYVIPFGDNFIEERFTIATGTNTFTLDTQVDLNQLENSMLVYLNGETLLCVDSCFVFDSFDPITITIQDSVDAVPGDEIIVKIYNEERDSAQCPPTPSTMGIYPLFQPEIIMDTTFQTPIEVIVGHDGSRTPAVGDLRDTLLLEFEKRIFDAAKREFRDANSLPEYNRVNIRGGAFRRGEGFQYSEWYDLLRHNFALWSTVNEVDPVVNEFFNEDSEWTWNYNNNLPGHWRGIYEYYYDTVQPHVAPWEMLGFTEKPRWWDEEYVQFTQDALGRDVPFVDYSSNNTHMWEDLEEGIIRQGRRENLTRDRYLFNNPYRRVGLRDVIPVDENGDLISPYRLFSTDNTTRTIEWTNASTNAVDPDYEFRTNTWLPVDGVNVSYDNSNIYVVGNAIINHDTRAQAINITGHQEIDGESIDQQPVSYSIPRIDLNTVTESPSNMRGPAVATMVNGLPLYNINTAGSWNDEGEWNYNIVEQPNRVVEAREGLLHYHTVTPAIVGLEEWDTETHSPIVGWAFDGLPIYGPYGYEDAANTASNIVAISSAWTLSTTPRASGPGGLPTGLFIEDYELDTNVEGTNGYANRYNARYGFTPDSPNEEIWYYVMTLDADLAPAFPYAVGGGEANGNWANNYFATSSPAGQIGEIIVQDQGGLYTNANVVITGDGTGATADAVIVDGKITEITITNNGRDYTTATATIVGDGVRAKIAPVISEEDSAHNNAYVNENADDVLTSDRTITLTRNTDINGPWKFGDGAPVENAWKNSELFPYAVAEALLLAKPGRFATVFADPTKLFRPEVDRRQLYNKDTGRRWNFNEPSEFVVHGDRVNGQFTTNIGYTQFIHSWLTFQNLDTSTMFAEKMRTLNMKLAHRMSGFVDKDTMIARTDQFSSAGSASSLIIPQENVDVVVHSSPYKSRNYYSGVIVEQTATGYRVRGYDRSVGYFNTLESDTAGPRSEVVVGGQAAAYSIWEPEKTYKKGTIVQHLGGFYQAPITISTGSTFDRTMWTRLPTLPQIGAARGVLYQQTTERVVRVNYNTEFETVQEVYDFLISLGRYQQAQGFDFGSYDDSIGEVRNWAYSAKQFLFWTTGQWEIGNTIELSPIAGRLRFTAPRGFVAQINRTEREQFAIIDQFGEAIDPRKCEIIREDDYVEIVPPGEQQIYGTMLFVREIEHVVAFDNVTQFNDVIYDPVLNQRHDRIKIKARRTAGWTGKLLTHGFIVSGSELLPNPDNLAESMGRYYEFGFIPVEKDLYDSSRALFGYTSREYMRELDIVDDQQFDFYRGMIQNKGTSSSLQKIARSSSIIQGNVTVFDEWALRIADFGDTENNQSIELKLDKQDIVQDPQLVTLDFPENVTNVVERVDVLEARYNYTQAPTIEIAQPEAQDGVQATAFANLGADGKLASITVTEEGRGYGSSVEARVIASNVLIDTSEYQFRISTATMVDYVDLDANSTVTITDNISGDVANVTLGAYGNVDTVTEFVDTINNTANVNVSVTASIIETHTVENGNAITEYSVLLAGDDFDVLNGEDVGLADGNYQPRQRFEVLAAAIDGNDLVTETGDITVIIDGEVVPDDNGNAWTYDEGSIVTLTVGDDFPTANLDYERPAGNIYYPLVNENPTFAFGAGNDINTLNLEKDSAGNLRFVDVFVNGTQINNVSDSYDSATGNVITQGTLFEVSEAEIVFPDVNRLPKEILEVRYNPPLDEEIPNGEQREIYYTLAEGTQIRVVEKSTVQFNANYQGDIPGADLNIRVTADDGIATRIIARRSYDITPDAENDDVILIDIDDSERFLRKPSGVRDNNLWATTDNVDSTGVLDEVYPTVRNAGYVNRDDVKFEAYDAGALPDLFDDNIIVKPRGGDLIHIASAERDDWNVYRLSPINSTTSFLFRNNSNKVNLYTDYSLFNYLDTNQIGAENTGKYMDYFLTLNNANVSDNVVLWRNEDVVTVHQSALDDIEAPRMIEARIASIGPAETIAIESTEPVSSATLQGLTVNPVPNSNTVVIRGNTGQIRDGDAVQLIDNVGTTSGYFVTSTSPSAGVLELDATYVSEITLDTAGAGYTEVPNVTISAPPSGGTAEAFARIDGSITSVTVVDDGDYTTASAEIVSTTGANAEITTDIVNAVLWTIEVTDPGFGYSSTAGATVTVSGSGTATITNGDIDPATGEILRIRVNDPGGNYTASNPPTVTIEESPAGANATAKATATVRGNVAVTVVDGGDSFETVPEIRITGDSESAVATAEMNATISRIVVTDPGFGYDTVPAVTIDAPASGTTATASATLNQGVDEIISLGSNATITLRGQMSTTLAADAQSNVALEPLFEAVQNVIGASFEVTSANATTGVITISDDDFDADVVANIDNLYYEVSVFEDYEPLAANATYHIVSNVTNNSFEIERAGTAANNRGIMALHLNNTRINATAHGAQSGEIVRINTDVFSGMYKARSVTANSFVIDSPYTFLFNTGSIIKPGIKITTVVPHGITPMYANNGKRIAVHFALPLYYNKVYNISEITPDTITIDGRWPRSNQTEVYYEERVAYLNSAAPYDEGNVSAANATNTISVTENVLLTDIVALYNSNSEIVPPSAISNEGDFIVIDTISLPTDANVSVGITLMRQEPRNSNRYPVLTTIDHNKAVMNGSTLTVDSFNNIDGLNTSLNRNMNLRRSFTNTDAGFGLRFGMMRDHRAIVSRGDNGRGLPAYQIGNYGPYVRDADLILASGGNQIQVVGDLELSNPREKELDTDFNRGPDIRGPDKGLEYTDVQAGIVYRWNPALRSYRAAKYLVTGVSFSEYEPTEAPKAPEYHQEFVEGPEAPAWEETTADDIQESADPTLDITYRQGFVVKYNSEYYVAVRDVVLANNTTFEETITVSNEEVQQWRKIIGTDEASVLINESLILTRIPGSGSGYAGIPGRKQRDYNMIQTVTFGSVTLPAFRLRPNTDNAFEVYQAVENDLGDVYYILLDKTSPPNRRHNYYGTVNRYSDFLGYPSTAYYYNNASVALNGSNQITNINDPVRIGNENIVLEMPPVEPAAYVGAQIIPEPFAVTTGPDAVSTFEGLPGAIVQSPSAGQRATVTISEPAYNTFLLWTPGLEPGKWTPTSAGPGQLTGVNNRPTPLGFGRGYYQPNDTHLAGEYPVTGLRYDQPLPRFMYNKKFSVFPPVRNRTVVVYTDSDGNVVEDPDTAVDQGLTLTTVDPVYVEETDENVANQGLRPEEIFVACFWTEPFTYQNQLVGYDLNNVDNNGEPTQIYEDYEGTIVRVKYIRLTELPVNAVTQRLIPDTGWGGRAWNNRRADDINLSSETEDDDSIWELFSPNNTTAGSTGDEAENPQGLTLQNDQEPQFTIGNTIDDDQIITPEGGLRNDLGRTDTVPVTEFGPILNASVLEGLPGPCLPVPQPEEVGSPARLDCGSVATTRNNPVLSKENMVAFPGVNNGWYLSEKFANANSMYVLFNTMAAESGIGISVIQSATPYDPSANDFDENEWWSTALVINDTISSGTRNDSDGTQIGEYGVDRISQLRPDEEDDLFEQLGVSDNAEIDALEIGTGISGTNWLPIYSETTELGVKGAGFIQRFVNCRNGEYLTLFVKQGAPISDSWVVLFSYLEEVVAGEDGTATGTGGCSEAVRNSPSRGFTSGAIIREWYSNTGTFGYLGQRLQGERTNDSVKQLDNIYYPYNPLPTNNYPVREFDSSLVNNGDSTSWGDSITTVSTNSEPNRWAGGQSVGRYEQRRIQVLANTYTFSGSFRTVEIKGYFRAPYTGTYTFKGQAFDSLWMWLSSSFVSESGSHSNKVQVREGRDDLHPDGEYFTQDGYRPQSTDFNTYMNSKDYHRDNYVLRSGFMTTNNKGTVTSHVKVELEEGKYYFVRLLSSNRQSTGKFSVSWTCSTGSGVDLDIFEDLAFVEGGQYGWTNIFNLGASTKTGALAFSGRECPIEEVPPEDSGDDGTTSGSTGGSDGSSGLGGSDTRDNCVQDPLGPRVNTCSDIGDTNFIEVTPNADGQWFYDSEGNLINDVPDANTLYRVHIGDGHFSFYVSRAQAVAEANRVYGAGTYSATANESSDTPVFNPAPGVDPEEDVNAVTEESPPSSDIQSPNEGSLTTPIIDDLFNGGDAIDTEVLRFQNSFTFNTGGSFNRFGSNIMANFSGYSQLGMTGYNFMPTTFKRNSRIVTDPAKYGYTADIGEGKFVSATHQRVSGGKVVPLTRKLTSVNSTPRRLRNIDLREDPWTRILRDSAGLSQTSRTEPARIGGSVRLNGQRIPNVFNRERNQFSDNPSIANADGTTNNTVDNSNTGAQMVEPQQYTRFDNRNIRYNTRPAISITPLIQDGKGNFVGGGPTATAHIARPTPQAEISREDLIGIDDNTELYINGKKIIIRGPDLIDIKNQINCASMGVRAELTVSPAPTQGTGNLVISSCDGSAWTVANGCSGGRYKQVGDFHINRGFEQSRNTTTTEQVVYPLVKRGTSGSGNATIGFTQQTPETTTINRYVIDNNEPGGYKQPPNDGEPPFPSTPFDLPAIVPLVSETSTSSVGGSNYRVGDRLRLIGGTPVNNTKGPLTVICIDSAGAGYTDPANVQIVINSDGNAPGIGAAATVTELDENGGIAEIVIVNQGAGYDIQNPPTIEVVDNSPLSQEVTVINTAWPDQIAVQAGEIVRVDYQTAETNTSGDKSAVVTINQRFVRATAPVTFGQDVSVNITNTNIAYVSPSSVPNSTARRVQVQVTDIEGSFNGWMRPNSYVELTFTPGTNANADPVTAQFWVPEPGENDVTVGTNSFIIEDSAFTSQDAVETLFGNGNTITVTARRPWWKELVTDEGVRSSLVDTVNPNLPKIPATLSSKIAIRPDADLSNPQNINDRALLDGYKGVAGPLRVAKFIVTGVTDEGAITSLKIIDRGLYKIFPSDLTFGLPLEYDYETQGSAAIPEGQLRVSESQRAHTLGIVDPARDNAPYGTVRHPEYTINPFTLPSDLFANTSDTPSNTLGYEIVGIIDKVDREQTLTSAEQEKFDIYQQALSAGDGITTPFKHPDWASYPEFYWNGQEYVPYTGSPGAYDPSTFVIVNTRTAGDDPELAESLGLLLRKQYEIVLEGLPADIGKYKKAGTDENDFILPGGTGARVFLTAQEVPDCSEKGQAKESLGLPDRVTETNAPRSLANQINNALTDAGYDPTDITFTVTDIGDIGQIDVETDFPGINIDSPTPGFLEKLGIPIGDYNTGMLCIEGTLENPNQTDEQTAAQIERLANSGAFGVLDENELAALTGVLPNSIGPTRVLSLLCVDRIGPEFGGNNISPLNDNNSLFNGGSLSSIRDLFKYDLTNIYGDRIRLTGTNKKENVNVFVYESKRFNNLNTIEQVADSVEVAEGDAVLRNEANAWVDNYEGQGWAYLENGEVKRRQEPLVDVNRIHNAIIYNGETGVKTTDLEFYDPFKGVLPGFVRNEIHFIGYEDPVSYNDARTGFGRNNVGKVWWDTSTVRYRWYEQGTNQERWRNWGSSFPGSSITVCEWVESKALPQNWTGNGVPRWNDRYITERRVDSLTGDYELYYYYWVQNRSVVDDRIKRDQGRKMDTQTVAQYIANPAGFGLNLISFVSDESFILNNVARELRNDENHLQINLSRNLNPNGLDHTAWKLTREGDDNSIIPEHLTSKLIDSLSGENALGQAVPEPRLSTVERYGVGFRPRQTMFRNAKDARRIMAQVINEMLADIKLESQFPNWNTGLPNLTYVENTNWFAPLRTDPITNQIVRYDDSYKPVLNVPSVAELDKLNDLPDGTVVQVRSTSTANAELWLYVSDSDEFTQIAILNNTIRFRDAVWKDDTTPVMSNEIRLVLTALKDRVFTNTANWNKFFFALMKHAILEQGELSWAFKTSYLYIEKTETDLIQFNGFKPDNFENVIEYMNEVKPYNAKIREYKDGKQTAIDLIGQNNISDYDKPPYVDDAVRVLNENNVADAEILATDPRYADYYGAITSGDTTPLRKLNTRLVFDRTNWRITAPAWDKVETDINVSMAENIATLTQMSRSDVESNTSVRAIDRIFKLDPEVQSVFANEINTFFNDTTAADNADIAGNADAILTVIEADQLKATFAMLKTKVGGDWRGEVLNGGEFNSFIEQYDYVNNVVTEFGYELSGWDENTDNDTTLFTDGDVTTVGIGDEAFDKLTEIVSYEGVFNGEATLRVDGESYEGFDGVTFQRVLYGAERPEELVLLDPLESLVMTVTTVEFDAGRPADPTPYDPLDVANANVFYAGVSAESVNIENGGVGYRDPTVVFFDVVGNAPITTAEGIATVDGNGSVIGINITDPGEGYVSIGVRLEENLTETVTATAPFGSNIIDMADIINIKAGQEVANGNVILGIVEEIIGTSLVLNQTLTSEVTAGTVLSLSGIDFYATVDTGNILLANVFVDKQFAESQLVGRVPFEDANSTSVVRVANVTIADITNIPGFDPEDINNFFAIDLTNGWDTATINNDIGSFDVTPQQTGDRTFEYIPGGREVTFRIHQNLFGGTDYLRIRPQATTTLANALYTYDTEMVVNDASFLPEPTINNPGMIWVGSERVHFARRVGNTLSMLTRGALGTTPQDHEQGTDVYSAEESEHFNHLNPQSNVWLDVGTRYTNPSTWDEAILVFDGDPNNIDDWNVQIAWDKIEAGNVIISNATATVSAVTTSSATLTLDSPLSLEVNEGIKVTSTANTSITEVVRVSSINGNIITVESSFDYGGPAELDTTLFIDNDSVTVSSFDYGVQADEDTWDAAQIAGQTARSLADIENADFTLEESIMRFLHGL